MSDLNNMMIFHTVVEKGSFTNAAKKIGLPKSNISRKISQLESELGVRLLERTTRSLHLTEIGRIFFSHCERIHEEIANADNCVETMAASPRGKLRLCTSISIGQALIAPLLPEFCRAYPDIEIDLQLTNRRVDIVEEGFDLALRVGELNDSSIIAKQLTLLGLHLYASPEYLKQSDKEGKRLDTPDELTCHLCLMMNAVNTKPVWELLSDRGTEQWPTRPVFTSDDFAVLRQMALDGAGVVLLPDYLCASDLSEKKLERVLDNWSGVPINLYALYPNKRSVTPKLRVMLDFLSARFDRW